MQDTEFEHITIDLSTRPITMPDKTTLTIILIETNTPLSFTEESSAEIALSFILGRAIQPRKPFSLDVRPFNLIILNCCDHWGCFVCAPARRQEETSFQMKLIEGDQIKDITIPIAAFGMQCQFGFIGFTNGQRVRIETIEGLDAYFAEKEALDREMKGDA